MDRGKVPARRIILTRENIDTEGGGYRIAEVLRRWPKRALASIRDALTAVLEKPRSAANIKIGAQTL